MGVIKPIELRSRIKGLHLQMREGSTEWLNGGKTKILHPPIYLQFEKGQAKVTDRTLERLGMTRDECLANLRRRAGGDFFIVEDIPEAAATPQRSK
jgi:hypothetical protein